MASKMKVAREWKESELDLYYFCQMSPTIHKVGVTFYGHFYDIVQQFISADVWAEVVHKPFRPDNHCTSAVS